MTRDGAADPRGSRPRTGVQTPASPGPSGVGITSVNSPVSSEENESGSDEHEHHCDVSHEEVEEDTLNILSPVLSCRLLIDNLNRTILDGKLSKPA
jgi:hypothetical protein